MKNWVRYAGAMAGWFLYILITVNYGYADTIRLTSGKTIESDIIWLENGKVNCEFQEISVGFPLERIEHIVKKGEISQEDINSAEKYAVRILFDIHENEPVALDRLFRGKSTQLVEGFFGPPDRKLRQGQYRVWQYGDTGSTDDIAIIIFKDTVADVTFY